jgi:hypothetical protein
MRFDSSSRPRLRVRYVWPRPGLAVVRVTGEIDLMSVPVLAAHLRALASEHKPQRVILDLAEVTIREAHAITLLVHVACDDIDIALHLSARETGTGRRWTACDPADSRAGATTISTSPCSSTRVIPPLGRLVT